MTDVVSMAGAPAVTMPAGLTTSARKWKATPGATRIKKMILYTFAKVFWYVLVPAVLILYLDRGS